MGFSAEEVAVDGRPGRVTLGTALLVSAAQSCRKVSLEVSICAGKESAGARSVHVLGDRPTVVKIFTRSCLPILYYGDRFSANAFRVPVSEQLISADTALLHLVLGLGMFICLPFSNT